MTTSENENDTPSLTDRSPCDVSDDGERWEVPEDHGLLIQLLPDGTIAVETVPDQHYPKIHPNCYAPADLENVRLLHGGGSGTAVFGGFYRPKGQAIVMKHGGPKDTKEVFSLAVITSELLLRRRELSEAAADHMSRRLPVFLMVYISPHHLRDRGGELWASVRAPTYTRSGRRLSVTEQDTARGQEVTLPRSDLVKLSKLPAPCKPPSAKRRIRVATNDGKKAGSWIVSHSNVEITLLNLTENGKIGEGIAFLREFCAELVAEEELHSWKVTLGQKWIGGTKAINGADILTRGDLQGALLETLIREFSSVMQDLDRLTHQNERQGRYELVQREVERLRTYSDVLQVSKTSDSFVGRSICKNFHPTDGRFRNLRLLGDDFREGNFFLTDAEQAPARFLGKLLKPGANATEVFEDASSPKSALDAMEDLGWLNILEHATQFNESTSAAATECLWTSGLTDAGLHNTFLSVERGLEIFDLGEPTLEPRPAFLTKFLMSFFHTIGMESDGSGSWKCRFNVVPSEGGGERLSPTPDTEEKIPYLRGVFTTTLDHIIESIFSGDESVRKLLLKYIVLQLLSDSSFCLQRWEAKGGGVERCGDRSDALAKWLWRSLWDQYVASYVYTNLLDQPDAN